MARTTARAGDMEECTDVESNEHMQKEHILPTLRSLM